MGLTMALLPIALLLLGFPFFLILLSTAAAALAFFGSVPTTALHQVMYSSIDKFALLAVPFFIFAGDLMGRGGVSRRLVRWVTAMLGGIRGALPFTALGTTAVFSAVSGSTAATVAAVGSLTYDRLREAGYSERFSAGLLVSAAAMDNLIPPSIGFILYGISAETSIVKLFAAGIGPGLVLAGFMGLVIAWYVRRTGEGRGAPFSLAELWAATRDGIWSIAAPVAVLGGIYAGVFSPTEAAGIACVYALIVVGLVYREIGWGEIYRAASRSMYLTAQVFVIVACAGVFSWLLTINGVPQRLVAIVTALDVPPWLILFAINLFLLGVGMVLDTASSILVLTPLLAPVAKAIGVDPVHFGVIVVMNLSIGTFTPPFGINLFVGQAVFKLPLSTIYPGVVPFIFAAIGALLLVTYVPWISLSIPRLL
ncbi:MAG: TRAP transporter large permease [Burkholderiaceae bacterium]|nr:TRAP transporter large permease [Burkholderiales bacterium]MCZ8339356.1 TRAP transporter large permease [Burkholderiaceae bacterium]